VLSKNAPKYEVAKYEPAETRIPSSSSPTIAGGAHRNVAVGTEKLRKGMILEDLRDIRRRFGGILPLQSTDEKLRKS